MVKISCMRKLSWRLAVLLSGIILGVLLFSQCSLFTFPGDDSGQTGDFSAFQLAVLEEINLARTSPATYAKQRLTAGNSNGAYEEFSAAAAVPALKLNAKLCEAAGDYARYLASHNQFSHTADGTVSERIERTGYTWQACGENLAAGSASLYNAEADARQAAEEFVAMLIIDEGVPSLGHRKNIRSADFTELGAGFARDTGSTYVHYHVQNFGTPKN